MGEPENGGRDSKKMIDGVGIFVYMCMLCKQHLMKINLYLSVNMKSAAIRTINTFDTVKYLNEHIQK